MLLRNVVRLVAESLHFALGTRRWTLALASILGLLAIVVAFTAATTAPLVIYPVA
jgi:hypothetical protein